MYSKMYAVLFNALTDALEALDGNDCVSAVDILKDAQRKTEEIYISAEDGAKGNGD